VIVNLSRLFGLIPHQWGTRNMRRALVEVEACAYRPPQLETSFIFDLSCDVHSWPKTAIQHRAFQVRVPPNSSLQATRRKRRAPEAER